VSIGTKNIISPVKDANIGYIFMLRFIFFIFCYISNYNLPDKLLFAYYIISVWYW